MVLEHAVLDVIPEEVERFEEAFVVARPIISSMRGCRSVRLERCIEMPSRYLLLVEWDRLEDHTEGFRGSDEYQEWRRLLHHFYEPFPTVEHYEPVPTRDAM
jgi:heme-degrading monooxygenase HmoA